MSAAHGHPRQSAKLVVKGIKITVVLPPAALPVDLVPPEPLPAGDPVLDLELEGGSFTVRAKFNGKSYRRALKVIAEHGADGTTAIIQGGLRPPAAPGGPFVLDSAGLAVTPKASKPEPTPPLPGGPANPQSDVT
jgi:hypothetical protein